MFFMKLHPTCFAPEQRGSIMEYYCIMVMTGEEKKYKAAVEEAAKEKFPDAKFYFFERKLYTPKRGWFIGKVFPSYIFFSVERLTPEFFTILKSQKGFCRILSDNQNPTRIQGSSLEELKIFIRNGGLWGVSKIVFLPGQKIKAVSGPLVGLEGNIVRVNKKSKQITVAANVASMSMRFDLKFEEAEKVEEV